MPIHANLQEQISTLTRELTEAREQQTATSEVLRVISSSPGELEPVFQTMLENAARVCGAKFGLLFRFDGNVFHLAAGAGTPPELAEFLKQRGPFHPKPGSRLDRLIRTKTGASHVNVAAEADPPHAVKLGGARSMLEVPMLKDDVLIGAIVIYRQEVRPFTDKQIALVQNFANQAVIAIENARLLNELRARTNELARSVEELQALGHVSQAVNSTLDLVTVLSTIVSRAVELSGTDAGTIYEFDKKQKELQLRSTYGMTEELIEALRGQHLGVGESIVDRAVACREPVQIEDLQANPPTPAQDIIVRAGFRALLVVPLLGRHDIVGALVVRRKAPGAFPKSTVDLLKTFASQSVLAIQNAHLFSEIDEKNRQLEEASRHKTRFLAAASHDLRQPLHALGLFVEQLREHAVSPEGGRLINRIDAAVAGMNDLFNALLDITKLDAGALTPTIAGFPIAELFARIESTFAPVAQEKRLSLRLVSSSVWVRSDPVLLERIVLNLVSNAVRYTTSGGIVVGCRHRGAALRIEVADSGPGIPEDQRRKIFSEFYRLADAAKTNQAGLGLGLAIVERLCALLDHTIELASTPGKGSRFSITVPTAPAAALPKSEPTPVAAIDVAWGKLVVVIDNDARVLEGMGGVLRNWGCRVVTAATPESAVTGVNGIGHDARPDLIISDYHLNDEQSGITAIAKLREAYGAVPALVMSGDTAPERLQEARASGHHLLHKPVEPMKLRAIVSQLLTKSQPA